MALDINKIREDFPILKRKVNGNDFVYFDNAATSQKPNKVIDSIVDYYKNYNSNIHRGVHTVSQEATDAYEGARTKIQKHFNVKNSHEIIFTSGTTHSINIVANGFKDLLNKNDEIIISGLEHHSNIVPWQMMAEKNGCSGFFIMAEGSQIDWAGHENDFDYQYEEMDEFHDVVGHALEYVKSRDDTLLIVLSDHETGGLLIEMDELRRKPSNSMLLSWNTALEEGTHTGSMIPAFSYGPGAINFTGVIDNTDVFFSLKEAIGINGLADKECKLND